MASCPSMLGKAVVDKRYTNDSVKLTAPPQSSNRSDMRYAASATGAHLRGEERRTWLGLALLVVCANAHQKAKEEQVVVRRLGLVRVVSVGDVANILAFGSRVGSA